MKKLLLFLLLYLFALPTHACVPGNYYFQENYISPNSTKHIIENITFDEDTMPKDLELIRDQNGNYSLINNSDEVIHLLANSGRKVDKIDSLSNFQKNRLIDEKYFAEVTLNKGYYINYYHTEEYNQYVLKRVSKPYDIYPIAYEGYSKIKKALSKHSDIILPKSSSFVMYVYTGNEVVEVEGNIIVKNSKIFDFDFRNEPCALTQQSLFERLFPLVIIIGIIPLSAIGVIYIIKKIVSKISKK